MAKKTQVETIEQNRHPEEIDYARKAAELEKSIEEVEQAKADKKFAREEKKFLKEHELKRKNLERFVAPLLLLATILISYFIVMGTQVR